MIASRPVLELSEIKESKEGSKNTALTDTVVVLDVDVRKWLSVDPLADKYPGISPYAYCNWNPVKFVDPDGKAIHVAAGAIIGAVIGGTISGISAMNDPNNWETKNGDVRNPRAGLGHELKHSSDIDKGKGNSEKINGIPIMEIDAINMENKVRQQTGDSKRTTYGGKEIPSNLLD